MDGSSPTPTDRPRQRRRPPARRLRRRRRARARRAGGARQLGLFEVHGGHARRLGEALAAPGSAPAGLYGMAAKKGLAPLHSPAVMAETAAAVAAPGIDDPGLVDLTHLPFVTIDEAHSQDLDQALYVETRDAGVVNLGHGILPMTPSENARLFVETIKDVTTEWDTWLDKRSSVAA